MQRILRALLLAFGLSLVLVVAAFAWEGRLYGQPAGYVPGASYGVFVWNDDPGMHLRTANADATDHHFSGTIYTDGTIINLHVISDGNDFVCICPNGHTITYSFHTWMASDGLDYGISGGTYQTVAAYNNGNLMETQNIHLGANDAHPADNPFIDHREP